MKQPIIVMLLVASVIISLRSPDVWACRCAPLPEPLQALEGSEYVFHGIPDSFEEVGHDLLVTFEVISVWKGPVAETLSVLTAQHPFACGILFNPELEYIVYADPRPASQPEAHVCTRTRVYSDDEAAALGDPLPPGSFSFRRGDANADGNQNLTDAVFVLNHLFGGGPEPTCTTSADANDSGTVDIADPIFLLNFLFAGGPPPAAPFPECGPDLTPDDLTCESFETCQ